jgi:N6-L-threonylcarbamoyladenine synthase
MVILSIETSCDETAIAIIHTAEAETGTAIHVLADNTLSQVLLHKEYGGVFPMLAKREHARTLIPLLVQTLRDAGLYKRTSRHVIEHPLRPEFQDIFEREPELFAQFVSEIPYINPPKIDAIAVTQGPGLEPALWVGINLAKALSLVWKTPIIPVNHMEGHFMAGLLRNTSSNELLLEEPNFPVLGLLVSGGHTELVLMRGWSQYEIIGETRDDAVGEAFDKVARILGLPYPGGPQIAKFALMGDPRAFSLPRPMLHSGDLHFSFSGLKTAVLYLVRDTGDLTEERKANIARAFEDACVEVLVTKTIRAAKEYAVGLIVLGGGVSANERLRSALKDNAQEMLSDIAVRIPEHKLTTDNALMIAVAGFVNRDRHIEPEKLKAVGNWRLGRTP